jgi:hypothetical protein
MLMPSSWAVFRRSPWLRCQGSFEQVALGDFGGFLQQLGQGHQAHLGRQAVDGHGQFTHLGRQRRQALVDPAHRQAQAFLITFGEQAAESSASKRVAHGPADDDAPHLGNAMVPGIVQDCRQFLRGSPSRSASMAAPSIAVGPRPTAIRHRAWKAGLAIITRPAESVITTASGVRSTKSARRWPAPVHVGIDGPCAHQQQAGRRRHGKG